MPTMNDDEARQFIEYLWGRPPKNTPDHPLCVKHYAGLTALRTALDDRKALLQAIADNGVEPAVQYVVNAARRHVQGG